MCQGICEYFALIALRQRAWRLEFCEADQLLPPPLRARHAACLDHAPPPNNPNPQKRTPTRSRHRAPRICASPEHQVCEFSNSAVQTTCAALATRTFDGPACSATRNNAILTIWLDTRAPPGPALAKRGDIVQNHHNSSASSATRPAAPAQASIQSRPHRAPHATRRTRHNYPPPWPLGHSINARLPPPLIRGPPGSSC